MTRVLPAAWTHSFAAVAHPMLDANMPVMTSRYMPKAAYGPMIRRMVSPSLMVSPSERENTCEFETGRRARKKGNTSFTPDKSPSVPA